jgi:hypothetical protein
MPHIRKDEVFGLGYYLAIKDNSGDARLAEMIGLSLIKYRRILKNEYNAYQIHPDEGWATHKIYFKKEEDAQKALDNFITPRYLAFFLSKPIP